MELHYLKVFTTLNEVQSSSSGTKSILV